MESSEEVHVGDCESVAVDHDDPDGSALLASYLNAIGSLPQVTVEETKGWASEVVKVLHSVPWLHRMNVVKADLDGTYLQIPPSWITFCSKHVLLAQAQDVREGERASTQSPLLSPSKDASKRLHMHNQRQSRFNDLVDFVLGNARSNRNGQVDSEFSETPEWLQKHCPEDLVALVSAINALRVQRHPIALDRTLAFPKTLRRVKGFTPKKQHEVTRMASFLAGMCEAHGMTAVIDIGAGSNYVGHTLIHHTAPPLVSVGVDGDADIHRSAIEKGQRLATKKNERAKTGKAGKTETEMNQHIAHGQQRVQQLHKDAAVPCEKATEPATVRRVASAYGVFSIHTGDLNSKHIANALSVATDLQASLKPPPRYLVESKRGLVQDTSCSCCHPTSDEVAASDTPSCHCSVSLRNTADERGTPGTPDALVACLHGCGDLTPCVLQDFVQGDQRVKGMLSVGCCYHAITPVNGKEKAWYIKQRDEGKSVATEMAAALTESTHLLSTAEPGSDAPVANPAKEKSSSSTKGKSPGEAFEHVLKQCAKAREQTAKARSPRTCTGKDARRFYSFPMSDAVGQSLAVYGFDTIAATSLRRAAAHRGGELIGQPVDDFMIKVNATVYRQLLEAVVTDHPSWKLKNPRVKLVIKRDCTDFGTYLRAALSSATMSCVNSPCDNPSAIGTGQEKNGDDGMAIRHPWAHESLWPLLAEMHKKRKEREAFLRACNVLVIVLQAIVAPLIEDLIVRDRCCFILEHRQEVTVHMLPLFDETLSPRCYAIHAVESEHHQNQPTGPT